MTPGRFCLLLTLCFSCASPLVLADDIYNRSTSAQSAAVAGANVAWANNPADAMAANPAALVLIEKPTLTLGVGGVFPRGDFLNRANSNGRLNTNLAFPEAAFSFPLGERFVLGVATNPQGAASDWRYIDTPGGVGGASYGLQENRSSILVVRTGVGLGMKLSKHFSIGGSLRWVYNRNHLETPYVFQTEPTLKGLKTLLNLKANGSGWGGSIGFQAEANDRLRFGAVYQKDSTIHAHDTANGDASVQLTAAGLTGIPTTFHYDSEVINHFPHQVSAGVAAKVHRRAWLLYQFDWSGWSDAFVTLPVRLTNGTNPAINGLLKSTSLNDNVPLNWKDTYGNRFGLDVAVTDRLHVSGGYAYATSPVHDSTLTPLTALINRHSLGGGASYRLAGCTIAAAYRADLPESRHPGTSQLLSGEYSNNTTRVVIHEVSFTVSRSW